MMYHVRYQVEESSLEEMGSPEALDADIYRRAARRKREKTRKRGKWFKEGLRDLRGREPNKVFGQDAERTAYPCLWCSRNDKG